MQVLVLSKGAKPGALPALQDANKRVATSQTERNLISGIVLL